MHRYALDYLKEWKSRPSRKPLVIRGARQVGKSFLARLFAAGEFANLLEVDFEHNADTASLFRSKDPVHICDLLEARFGSVITPGRTLLFLDEIQAAPEVFATLRYFHERLPDLHVVAAGSLLEFVLEQHVFSMPVGRIEYLHLGPLQFEEFLLAMGRGALRDFLSAYRVDDEIPEALHLEAMNLLRRFLVVGGLPEPVAAYAAAGGYRECAAIQQSVLSTYQDDFAKYGRHAHTGRMAKVFEKVPRLVGRSFKYSHVDREERAGDLQQALRLLAQARVVHAVRHSSANGIPLGAEADDRRQKVLFLDVGLLGRSCGLGAIEIENAADVLLVNSGAVCEQFVGQHLLHSQEPFEDPQLFCWMREKPGSAAEVDYLISEGAAVIPVEVKAGKTGALKSLHVFLREKKRDLALRFNSASPSLLKSETCLPDGGNRPFRLLSLPFYMVGQARRLIRSLL